MMRHDVDEVKFGYVRKWNSLIALIGYGGFHLGMGGAFRSLVSRPLGTSAPPEHWRRNDQLRQLLASTSVMDQINREMLMRMS